MGAASAAATREDVRADIIRLVHRDLSVRELARSATTFLRRAVPFDGACLLTIDPATLLPTGEVVQDALPEAAMVRLTAIELQEPDFNKFTALARGHTPAASLSDATGGDLDQSLRQRELRRPHGFEDELRSVLPGVTGTSGALTLLRETKRPHFTPAEVRFVGSLAGVLAAGLERAMLSGAMATDADVDAGLLVLAADGTIEMVNRSADRWLDELGALDRPSAHLPLVVHAIAARARHAAAVGDHVARARVRTPAGRWVVVRGSLLGDGPDARVAVLLEAARAPQLAPLLVDAYGFTERERLVTELVAQGCSTNEVAGRLHLSAYTVQDHLKAIFEKSGTSSRGELVARLFVDRNSLTLNSPEFTTPQPAVHAPLPRRQTTNGG